MSNIDHPKHYNDHESGIEAIDIAEHMSFNLGNAFKYLMRAGRKENTPRDQDLAKAAWYIRREWKKNNGSAGLGYNDAGAVQVSVRENLIKVLVHERVGSNLHRFIVALFSDEPWLKLTDLANSLEKARELTLFTEIMNKRT